ncbi:MAG: hypothetical protein IH623_12295 [Verrucomicrobia bacterium]|nr:hypothetical protein [Verrucomicrobiota bacterium]
MRPIEGVTVLGIVIAEISINPAYFKKAELVDCWRRTVVSAAASLGGIVQKRAHLDFG